jgi:hypothetical protein
MKKQDVKANKFYTLRDGTTVRTDDLPHSGSNTAVWVWGKDDQSPELIPVRLLVAEVTP